MLSMIPSIVLQLTLRMTEEAKKFPQKFIKSMGRAECVLERDKNKWLDEVAVASRCQWRGIMLRVWAREQKKKDVVEFRAERVNFKLFCCLANRDRHRRLYLLARVS